MTQLEILMDIYSNSLKLDAGDYKKFNILHKNKNLKDKPEELMISTNINHKDIILNFKPSDNNNLIVRTILPTTRLKVIHINMNHYEDLLSMDEVTMKLAYGITITEELSNDENYLEKINECVMEEVLKKQI